MQSIRQRLAVAEGGASKTAIKTVTGVGENTKPQSAGTERLCVTTVESKGTLLKLAAEAGGTSTEPAASSPTTPNYQFCEKGDGRRGHLHDASPTQ